MKFIFLTLLVYWSCHSANADDRTEFSGLLKNYQSLSGQFEQTLVDSNQELIQSSSGNFLLKKPGYFRWDTREPFPQLLVSDLETIWFYDPDLEQVTVRSYHNHVDQTPSLLLSGDADKISQNYVVTKLSEESFSLLPKSEMPSFTELQLLFKDQQLASMVLKDSLDQTTTFIFTEVKVNPDVVASDFQFTPPNGVDILFDD